jgi:hypothetical protein
VNLPHRTVPDPASTLNFEAIGAQLPVYAERLPDTPRDGQEIYYAADAANGVIWHLRYRSAASGSYKWDFLGGPPLFAEVTPDQNLKSTSYAALGGPSVTIPLAGDFDVEIGCRHWNSQYGYMSYDIGGTAASDADAVLLGMGSTGDSGSRLRRKTGLAASTALVSKYREYVASGTGSWFSQRWMRVVPIRVG